MAEPSDTTSRRTSIQSVQSLLSTGDQSLQSAQSVQTPQATFGNWRDALPPPEIDILRTAFFMHFVHTGGPNDDAMLHNQASILRMLQDIRATLVRLLPLDPGQGSSESRANYGDEIKAIFANEAMANTLKGFAITWIGAAPGNKMAKTRANKQLTTLANATFEACKNGLSVEWDRDDIDETDKELITLLKAIEQSQTLKEDLHIAMAKHLGSDSGTGNDGDQGSASTPSTNTRARGTSRGQSIRSRGTRGASQSVRGRQTGVSATTTTITATSSTAVAAAPSQSRDATTGQAARKRARVISDSEDEDDAHDSDAAAA